MGENENMYFEKKDKILTSIKNIVLTEQCLKAEKITTTYELTLECHPVTHRPFRVYGKKQISEVVEPMSFELKEISVDEIAMYRKSKKPSFLLKKDGKYFYATIPETLCFTASEITGEHMCGQNCRHMSAASDEKGGCSKVRNYATHIERYDYITEGYETFNTNGHDCFVVAKCLHYKKCKPHKAVSQNETNRIRSSLSSFMYD